MGDTSRHGQVRLNAQTQTPSGLPDTWARDLALRYRRMLSTKRMNQLSRSASQRASSPAPQYPPHPRDVPSPAPRHGSEHRQHLSSPPSGPPPSRNQPSFSPAPQHLPPPPPPPSYSSLKNIPLVPSPPTDRQSLRFRSLLHSLSNTPTRWENPGLLDEALRVVPLQRIYDEAQEEADTYAAEAASLGPHTKPAWGYQDCVIIALMRWFKRDFFTWVNNPKCTHCRSNTVAMGMAAPLPDEQARGANRVELYQCSHAQCREYERFPRYNDAFVLLQTRRGRVGEWANCFSMLCRAVGSRVRWVWNSEDHVWTEVYSVHRKRWVHVDVCEAAWDQPLLYTQGWQRKLAYCIAFSADGAMDVTRRYVRSATKHALQRTKAPEAVLLHIVDEIRHMRRRDMDKKEKFRLEGEDMREDREFRQFVIESLAKDIARLLPTGSSAGAADVDAQKAAERRADAEWARLRREQQDSRSGRHQ